MNWIFPRTCTWLGFISLGLVLLGGRPNLGLEILIGLALGIAIGNLLYDWTE